MLEFDDDNTEKIFLVNSVFVCLQQGKAGKKNSDGIFFKNPVKTAFQISPNGKYISYLQPYKNRLNIVVQSIDGGSPVQITSESNHSVSHYFWVNNNELLYTKDWFPGENEQLFLVEKNGGNNRSLLSEKGRILLLNTRQTFNNELLIALLNKKDSTVFDAYRLNINTGKLIRAAQNPGNITKWFADADGKLRLAMASDGVNETLLFRNQENESFKPVVTTNFKTTIAPVGFCKHSNSCIYALSNDNRDKRALIEFNCETGKEYKEVFSHPEVDVLQASYSTEKMQPEYVVYETWKKKRHFLDPKLSCIYKDLRKRFPGSEIEIVDHDSVENKFIINTYTDKNPGAFYLYILMQDKLTKLSDVNPFLPESEMCSMNPISYTARDGLKINGYLTLPKGKDPVNLPVVVLPHGGPTTRDSWKFNPEVQFLANRGYAVFQPNFRGSVGYGKHFWILGFKQWGRNMQNDITDGVKWLISRKIADKSRIAIYGSGFGGFSALYGLCFHSDLYACGASYSGLINLFTYMKDVPPYFKPFQQMYYERVGDPEKDADYFTAVSPVFHTDSIKDPVLIAQGAKDPRANLNEINQFVKELKKQNVPISYMLKENEGYYFRKQENRFEFYKRLEKFLSDNLNNK